uniref:Uncharacterized protein n=1 Tax=Porolithon onkodes TaxID=231751 RepID=A0A2Z2L633_9FLOR|nr:hypothetical protein [Porolithon onkodes]ASB29820.1 hypothetical protein [Porolithon onkodes]
MGQPRLQVYDRLIGSYDLLDKYKFSSTKFTKIESIIVYSTINKLTNKNLNLLFLKEFITKQCLNVYKPKKFGFLKKFVITLRKFFLYFYLELSFNFLLLGKKSRIIFPTNCKHANLRLNLDISCFSVGLLTEKSKSWNLNSKFNLKLVFKNQNNLIKTFLSYYFIC